MIAASAAVALSLGEGAWLLHERHREAEVASKRFDTARSAFVDMLRTDFAATDRAAEELAESTALNEALAQKDATRARALAKSFGAAHPRMEAWILDARGGIVAPTPTDERFAAYVLRTAAEGQAYHGMETRGCGGDWVPAYAAALPLPNGSVAVCLRIDGEYVARGSKVAGVDLAVLGDGEHFGSVDETFFKSDGFDHASFLAWWSTPPDAAKPIVEKISHRTLAITGERLRELDGLIVIMQIDLGAPAR